MSIFEIVGWTGTFLLVVGYLLVVKGRLSGQGMGYLATNLVGSTLVIANVAHAKVWPATALQAILILITLYGMAESRRAKATPVAAE